VSSGQRQTKGGLPGSSPLRTDGKVTAQVKELIYSLSGGCQRGEIVEDDDYEVRTTVQSQIHGTAQLSAPHIKQVKM
jgi:hypothetical protein